MVAPILAVAPELVFVAAGVAVALLLIFQLRLQQGFTTLDLDVQRLNKAHKEGALDARSRLEELEREVGPRFEALEPQLADTSARVDEMGPRIDAIEPRVEALEGGRATIRPDTGRVEQRSAESQEAPDDSRAKPARPEHLAERSGGRTGEVAEALLDARTRLKRLENGLSHLRAVHGEKFVEIGRHLDVVDHSLGQHAKARAAVAVTKAAERKAKKAPLSLAKAADPIAAAAAPEAEAKPKRKRWPWRRQRDDDIESEMDWHRVLLLILVVAAAALSALSLI